jgi:hypothetical protein
MESISLTVKAANATQDKAPDSEILIFLPKGIERTQIENLIGPESKLKLKTNQISAVSEIEDTKDLSFQLVNGRTRKKEKFGLVVLVSPLELSETTRELLAELGVSLTTARFQETAKLSLIKTPREKVSLIGYIPVS